MSVILSIDQGTSGTKAIVTDDAGGVLSIAEEQLHPRYLTGGGVEQDPRALLASVIDSGRRAVAAAGRVPDAVALANQGETVLAWDRSTGEPLSAAIVWQDRRADAVCLERADHADWVAQRTGLVLDSYFSAPKMRWLRDNVTTDGVVTTTDTWLIFRLCGAFVTDFSTASRSLVFDVDERRWDAELLAVFGLENEELPELVGNDVVVGTTQEFGGVVPVAGLIVDQQAALLAEACLEPGTAKCTYGTGAFLLAQTGQRAARSAHGLTTSVAWVLGGEAAYCVDGQVYTAASAVRWITDLGLIDGPDQLDQVASDDSGGVLCVPALAGLAAPWWDARATASWTGMTLSSHRGELVRSVLEGVAAQVANLMKLVAADTGIDLSRLRVDGGLTRSAVLMQAQADLAQVPVDVYPSQHATPLGAAACARLALDDSLSPADVVGSWRADRTYEPVWTAEQASVFLDRWSSAAENTLNKNGDAT